MRNVCLCRLLTEQGFAVVCCTISMMHSVREWNRENIENYKEIYLRVPYEILVKRDQKQLYSKVKLKEIKDVMGMDIEYEEPRNPDIIIDNDGILAPEEIIEMIMKQV